MKSLQVTSQKFAMADLTKAWPLPNFATFNVGALLSGHWRNVAALTRVNQVVFDGLRTLAHREREMFRLVGDMTGTTGEERATMKFDGGIFASRIARLAELPSIAVKINVSAMDIFNARVTEGFDELKALLSGQGATTTVDSTACSVNAEPIAVVDNVDLTANAIAAVAPAASVAPRSMPRTARPTKGAMTPTRASRAGTKTATRARKAGRRQTTRK